jgi:hypothetical protein
MQYKEGIGVRQWAGALLKPIRCLWWRRRWDHRGDAGERRADPDEYPVESEIAFALVGPPDSCRLMMVPAASDDAGKSVAAEPRPCLRSGPSSSMFRFHVVGPPASGRLMAVGAARS